MIKNTAGQIAGAQMVSATDGSAFTGTVSCVVTKDGGTQSAGGGSVTHEGNGFHSYTATQAETNADHIAFTFTGSGAIPSTVQVYTVAGDAFTRLGAPAGASVSADIAAMKVDTAAILDDTGTSGVVVSASSVRTAVGLASANLDTQLDALPTAAENADAVWDEATAGHTTSGTFGEQVKTDIDAILVDTGTTLDGKIDVIDSIVDDILVDTGTTLQAELDGIQADTEDIQARIPTALTAGGYLKADVLAIDGDTTAPDRLAEHAKGALKVVIGSGSTTTSLVLNATTGINGGAPSSTNDAYNGRVIVFLTGTLAGQATDITDYVGSTVTLTVTALTGSALAGDTAVIV